MFGTLALLLLSASSAAALSKSDYEEKASSFLKQQTKSGFIEHLNEQEVAAGRPKVSEKRGDRAWKYFEEQLKQRKAIFSDDDTVAYALPYTHTISRFIPEAWADIIESVLMKLDFTHLIPHEYYYPAKVTLHNYQRKIPDHIISFVQGGLFAFLAVMFLRMCIGRFTNGLSKETIAAARYYDEMKAKKAI
mmetsp:Transcript_40221/g.66775  ORF Transcript_40221/g.66775 Transcript_40221/m.66775 type:complete len:191 (-) Transcript_40221:488-1060(-)